MTLKEMFKKVDNYNEIAEMIGTRKQKIHIRFGYGYGEGFDSLKSFKAYLKREIADPLADAVLNCNEFCFDGECKFEFVEFDGFKWGDTVEVYTLDA